MQQIATEIKKKNNIFVFDEKKQKQSIRTK